MSNKPKGGLGGFSLGGRDAAVEALYQGSTDQPEPDVETDELTAEHDTTTHAEQQGEARKRTAKADTKSPSTGRASQQASNTARTSRSKANSKLASTDPAAPAPPPRRTPEQREQFNVRAKPEHKAALERYRYEHDTTIQNIFDQMVDEYCARRGIPVE